MGGPEGEPSVQEARGEEIAGGGTQPGQKGARSLFGEKRKESQIMIIILLCIASTAYGNQYPHVEARLDQGEKIYLVYDDGSLMREFNWQLSEGKLIALDKEKKSDEMEEILNITNVGPGVITITKVDYSSIKNNIVPSISEPTQRELQPKQSSNITLTQKCPQELSESNYWDVMKAAVYFDAAGAEQSFEFQFVFTCDRSFRIITFDWSLLILVTLSIILMGILANFGRINSFAIKFNDSYFQGFEINWLICAVFVSIYVAGFTLFQVLKTIDTSRYSIIVTIVVLGSLSTVFIVDEIINLAPKGSFWTRRLFLYFRVSEVISLCVTVAIVLPYSLTKAWYLSDLISIMMMATIVKLFKLKDLKNSFFLMIICTLTDCVLATIAHFVNVESYNVLTLKYVNCPLELQLPLMQLQLDKNCAWISLISIVIPGLFIGLNYRFDRNRRTHSYAIVCFLSLVIAEIVWIFTTVYQTHSWPSSAFTFPSMLVCVSLVALRRAEFRQFWEGNFYDEYLNNNYRLNSVFDKDKKEENFSLTDKLLDGLRPTSQENRRQSTDL